MSGRRLAQSWPLANPRREVKDKHVRSLVQEDTAGGWTRSWRRRSRASRQCECGTGSGHSSRGGRLVGCACDSAGRRGRITDQRVGVGANSHAYALRLPTSGCHLATRRHVRLAVLIASSGRVNGRGRLPASSVRRLRGRQGRESVFNTVGVGHPVVGAPAVAR